MGRAGQGDHRILSAKCAVDGLGKTAVIMRCVQSLADIDNRNPCGHDGSGLLCGLCDCKAGYCQHDQLGIACTIDLACQRDLLGNVHTGQQLGIHTGFPELSALLLAMRPGGHLMTVMRQHQRQCNAPAACAINRDLHLPFSPFRSSPVICGLPCSVNLFSLPAKIRLILERCR